MARPQRVLDKSEVYAVDRISEQVPVDFFEREIASQVSLILIAEGLTPGEVLLPRGVRKRMPSGASSGKAGSINRFD